MEDFITKENVNSHQIKRAQDTYYIFTVISTLLYFTSSIFLPCFSCFFSRCCSFYFIFFLQIFFSNDCMSCFVFVTSSSYPFTNFCCLRLYNYLICITSHVDVHGVFAVLVSVIYVGEGTRHLATRGCFSNQRRTKCHKNF